MSQIPPITASHYQHAPLNPEPQAAASSKLSAETKQKIAAVYAEAQTEHKSAAQVQQEVNAIIAQSPNEAASNNGVQSTTIDTTA